MQHTQKGMLSLKELTRLVKSGAIETVVTVFPDLYGRLMGKRITGDFFLSNLIKDGMHACNYLFTVDMPMEPIPGYQYANWEKGYGDFHCVVDMATLRRATWLEKSAMVFCDVMDDHHQLLDIAPRSILKQQVNAAAELGFSAKGASELEYFIFKNSYGQARKKNYWGLKPHGDYIEDYHILQGTREEAINGAARKHLNQSGVPVEFSKGEWGPGQHELNIRYAPLADMADRHAIYKQCLKEIADQQDMSVTFMAKWDPSLAGSSCHMHVSLWDLEKDTPAFPGKENLGPVKCSDVFRWFLGGWMAHAAEMTPFYAPTVNSYKRFQSGSWAPTGLAWSFDNRTAGFRVVGGGPSLRIESRIAGADVNPYLGYAAVLASGLDGIRNKIEPPPHFEGDVYQAADQPQIPKTFEAAIQALEGSSFARQAFGDRVVDHYLHFFKTERDAYQSAVTDWERRRYFEQI